MSFGTNLLDDEPGIFGEQLMQRLGSSLGVAAAGNQATCRPYFPAALPGVVGVGALAADGKAWFSNFGGWVDACAPGVDVVSTFFNDFTESLGGVEGRRYLEWARWSGTSFSAPKVAAVLAQDMYLYGGTAQQAWKRLTSHKHFRYPDLGIVFNV
jgi:subtilisin family serine protease